MDWLLEHNMLVYVLLGGSALIRGAYWWRTRERRVAIGVILMLVLLIGFAGSDLFYTGTPRRQIKHAIEEMAGAVKTKEVERIMLHISDDFRHGSTDKAAFRKFATDMITTGRVTEVKVWKFQPVEFKPAASGGKETATIRFMAKPRTEELSPEMYFQVLAHFVLDPDGQRRLSGFEIFMPPPSNQPVHIPYLPN